MEPWMKYTGISLAAGVITWFRIPRRERQNLVRSAFMAMPVFAAVAAAIIVVITLMSWAMPDRP
jgi:hypothetical protein